MFKRVADDSSKKNGEDVWVAVGKGAIINLTNGFRRANAQILVLGCCKIAHRVSSQSLLRSDLEFRQKCDRRVLHPQGWSTRSGKLRLLTNLSQPMTRTNPIETLSIGFNLISSSDRSLQSSAIAEFFLPTLPMLPIPLIS